MTEIMPFPENNILFYWAAPHPGAFFDGKGWQIAVYLFDVGCTKASPV